MTLRFRSFPWLVAALLPGVLCAAPATGVVLKAGPLRSEPLPTAQAVVELKTGSKVVIIERKGFWYQLEQAGNKGWAKVTEIKADSGESAGAGLAAMATGRGSTGNVVSTSGSRGLSAEELTSAQPDPAALAEVDKLKITPETAAAFAKSGKLATRTVEYLPAPAKPASNDNRGRKG